MQPEGYVRAAALIEGITPFVMLRRYYFTVMQLSVEAIDHIRRNSSSNQSSSSYTQGLDKTCLSKTAAKVLFELYNKFEKVD
jgi:hypothetical protein